MVELVEYGDMVNASDLSLTTLPTLIISVPDLPNERRVKGDSQQWLRSQAAFEFCLFHLPASWDKSDLLNHSVVLCKMELSFRDVVKPKRKSVKWEQQCTLNCLFWWLNEITVKYLAYSLVHYQPSINASSYNCSFLHCWILIISHAIVLFLNTAGNLFISVAVFFMCLKLSPSLGYFIMLFYFYFKISKSRKPPLANSQHGSIC